MNGARPVPSHLSHGDLMTMPFPPQEGHGVARVMKPVRWITWPVPRQVGQVSGWVPGAAPVLSHWSQGRSWVSSIFFLVPLKASSKER